MMKGWGSWCFIQPEKKIKFVSNKKRNQLLQLFVEPKARAEFFSHTANFLTAAIAGSSELKTRSIGIGAGGLCTAGIYEGHGTLFRRVFQVTQMNPFSSKFSRVAYAHTASRGEFTALALIAIQCMWI